jgi:hypothetical protein
VIPGNDGGTVEPPVVPNQRDHRFPVNLGRAVDILVVMDNSGSMDEEQINLTRSWSNVGKTLALLPGGLPALRIGVVSTDLGAGPYESLPSCEDPEGDGAKLQSEPRVAGCNGPTGAWIEHVNGTVNITGGGQGDPVAQISEAFTCIAKLGTGGCGYEYQLEAARRALDPSMNINPGFLRAEALLVVLFVTDEDDCSARDPSLFDPTQTALEDPLGPLTSFRCFEFGVTCDEADAREPGARTNCRPSETEEYLYKAEDYVRFFKQLKGVEQSVVAVIAGPPTPVEVIKEGTRPVLKESCSSDDGAAVPAIRLNAVVQGLGQGSFLSSICTADFAPALTQLGQVIREKLGPACLQPLGDADPGAPGLQVNCVVEDVLPSGQPLELQACKASVGGCDPCPCWRVAPQPECSSGHALDIPRADAPPPGLSVRARCQGA